ncbi:TetR/AcrR family transcriptional regulator [Buttiauxella warmboldiae]|uniref:TetR/AcrR family transcriptional regulator n=1 Tax=Buttiauxella warmboldiae TaxID=82993 RepID=A0A3N5D5W5_9ENTR|nr:TetR/AcrR family transcriptional regulator [Buttiauxella warmboldiae]RPH23666.1 TetR/AcrR family transcriptional regulator [Buttiauxella warmboldiae]
MSTDISCTKKSRGRPKVFDREAALDKAMALFWKHGYEATSMAHLVEATGAKAPTLYAEFTNKEGLFKAVLDRYIARFAKMREACLFCEERTLEEALEAYLSLIAKLFTEKDTPTGCFIICTSSVLAASSDDIAAVIKTRQSMQEETLARFLASCQQKGEIPAASCVRKLAKYLCCIIQGMSVSARENASYEELMQIVNTTMRLMPELKKI